MPHCIVLFVLVFSTANLLIFYTLYPHFWSNDETKLGSLYRNQFSFSRDNASDYSNLTLDEMMNKFLHDNQVFLDEYFWEQSKNRIFWIELFITLICFTFIFISSILFFLL